MVQATGFKAISYEQANDLLEYLTKQPYREVFKIIETITLLPEGLVAPIVAPPSIAPIVEPPVEPPVAESGQE